MENLSKREKLLVILLACLIVLYVYLKFFLNPINDKIKAQTQVLNDKKTEYASMEKLKVSNVKNEKKLQQIKNKFDESVKALPKNERNPEISYNINSLAIKNKVNVNTVAFGQIADYSAGKKVNNADNATSKNTEGNNQKLMLVPVTVVISGDYSSMVNFINSIENDNRITEIESVSISSKSEKQNGLQCNLLLNYYFSTGSDKDQPTYNIKGDNPGKENLFK